MINKISMSRAEAAHELMELARGGGTVARLPKPSNLPSAVSSSGTSTK